MPFVIPLGRYLGIRRGTDVVNPITPVRDPNANYAVVQLATGQTAAPEQFGVLLDAASSAPNLSSLIGKFSELAKLHPSGNVDVLKQEFEVMTQAGLLLTLDPQGAGLPEPVLKRFRFTPGERIALRDEQSTRIEESDTSLRWFNVAGKRVLVDANLVELLSGLPESGWTLEQVVDQLASTSSIADRAQALGVVEMSIQPLLNAQAVHLVGDPT